MIAIVDTGGANIASVQHAFQRLGQEANLTSDMSAIRKASHVILPGVGAAADSMERLKKSGLISSVRTLKQPVLGICLGMQLLFDSSEEGHVDCLKVIAGKVKLLKSIESLRLPHMGWNSVSFGKSGQNSGHPLLRGLENGSYFYFVHSFGVVLDDGPGPSSDFVLGSTQYGVSFASIVGQGNFMGVQFHPERSSQAGETILRNFLDL